jgi:outer membrane lipoprotein-sorting protein
MRFEETRGPAIMLDCRILQVKKRNGTMEGIRQWRRARFGCCLVFCVLLSACSRAPENPGASPSRQAAKNPAEVALHELANKYHAAQTYADTGEIVITTEVEGKEDVSQPLPFSVAFQRPSKLRLHAFDATVITDGDEIKAAIGKMSDQVFMSSIDDRLHYEDVVSCDELLGEALGGGMELIIPQLALLLSKNPVGELLPSTTGIFFETDETWDGEMCHRVRGECGGGLEKTTFWISAESGLLRRIEFTGPAKVRTNESRPTKLKIVETFNHAKINEPVPPEAFVLEPPPGVLLVRRFLSEVSEVMQKLVKQESLTPDEIANYQKQLVVLRQRFDRDIIGITPDLASAANNPAANTPDLTTEDTKE